MEGHDDDRGLATLELVAGDGVGELQFVPDERDLHPSIGTFESDRDDPPVYGRNAPNVTVENVEVVAVFGLDDLVADLELASANTTSTDWPRSGERATVPTRSPQSSLSR